MSGTASRFQSRFGYAPGLRVGTYPGMAQGQQAPATGAVAPASPFIPTPAYTPPAPSALAQLAAPPVAAPAPAPVTAGAYVPNPRVNEPDGAGDSAQGDYGGPGPSGIASTGNVADDAWGFANAAGRMGSGLMGSGVVGSALGVMGAGLVNALGFPETAQQIGSAIGLPGQITGYDPTQPNPAAYSEVSPGSTDGGLKSDTLNDPNTTVSYGSEFGLGPDNQGQDMGYGQYGPGGNAADYGDYGGGDKGDSAGDGSNGESSPGDPGGGDKGDSNGWQRGGYTGAGTDGVVDPARPAGTVHEGEAVIPANQVARYGLAPLLMLARGKVDPSRLAALMGG